MNQRGFSLLEVTIVLALVLVMCGLGISFSWRLFDTTLTRLEFDNIYMLFMQLQRQALIDRKTHTIQFDPVHNIYRWDGHEHALPAPVLFGTIPKASGPPSSPSRPLVTSITFPENKVTFSPDGHIQPGTLYVTDATKKILYALSCPVSDISYIRRYTFDTQWHLLS